MKMDESLLKAAIEQQEQKALGYQMGDLAGDRAKSLDAYLSRPMGNEIDGRSQVVTSDVADSIEGIMPGLIRVFTSGDDVCEFEPFGPEDEQQAKQETDYINYVLTQQNRILPILQTWLRDGLISKVGYVKAIWDESEKTEEETYRGLDEDQLVYLLQDKDVEIIGQAQDETGFSVKLKTKSKVGQVKIIPCPPEEVLVNADHTEVSLTQAKFAQHRTRMTISDVRAMGYDIPDDIGDDVEGFWGEEEVARHRYGDEWFNNDAVSDPAMRMVTYKESYVRIDFDGDGLAELRRVCMIGSTLLANEPSGSIPLCAWTPLIMPHRHVGRSMAEQVQDIQSQKTLVLRAGLDSLHMALNGRWAISDQVNLDDMLVSRPNGVVRMEGGSRPGDGHIQQLVPSDVSGNAFPMLEYFDAVRETRTGITRYNQGLDANSLNKTATGIQSIMSAAQQRIELVARTFAETGLRDLMLLVHELIRKNNTKPSIVRLRNKWVPVDPRSWKNRYDMTISVGLGTGNREHQMANITQILMAQKDAIQIGVATPENIYNSLAKLAEAAGFKAPEAFFTNPATQPQKPPQPDPKVLEAQANIQIEQSKMKADEQKNVAEYKLKESESQQRMAIEQAKLELEAEKLKFQMHMEQMKAQPEQPDNSMEQVNIQVQAEIEQMKLQSQVEIEKYKIDMAYQQAIEVAQINAGASLQAAQMAASAQYDRNEPK
jgi:hypothetical protein